MCGLAVLLNPVNFSRPDDAVLTMLGTMAHRGLPGRANFRDGSVYIGHVRLPIRGFENTYDQPFVTEDWIGAFVGEVFDIEEKNDALIFLDEMFHMGYPAIRKHDGFWAAVQYDKVLNITTVLVDHLAIKPLYWHKTLGVIASELRAIKAVVPLELDEHYLSNVTKWGYDPSVRTPYKDVERLEAGHAYVFQEGNLIARNHYFPLIPRTAGLLPSLVEKAVIRRLVEDTFPAATLCSGGLDSTIVSLLAARYSKTITVFHIENGESEYFDQICWPSNVSVVKIPLPQTALEDALRVTEEPVDLGSVLPQYALGQAIRAAGYHVVLSGDGADELFGGYTRSRTMDTQWSDIFSELVHYHNPRLDKTMMASTVELRTPFLAPSVIEAALAVHRSQRTNKQVLKKAFSDILPASILERDKKPLKTQAVKEGGQKYREWVISEFRKRHT